MLDVEVSFLIDMARSLELWDDDGSEDEPRRLRLETRIPAVTLRDLFFKYAGKRHLNSRSTETKLGKLWAEMGFIGGVKVRLPQETWINGKSLLSGTRVNGYILPRPEELRARLIERFQLPRDCFADAAEIHWVEPPDPDDIIEKLPF